MKNVTLLSMVFAVASCCAAQSAPAWQDTAAWHKVAEPKISRDIVYGDPADPKYNAKAQVLDVFQNATATGKTPVLISIHGGGWNHGNRAANWGGFRSYIAAGFSVVNMDYRLAGDASAPAAVQDVRCVLSWVKQNAAKYNFDADRVVTYGTSAGGHLALLAADLPAKNDIDPPRCKDQAKVVAVLDFYGPYHLEEDWPGQAKSKSPLMWIGSTDKAVYTPALHSLSPSTYTRVGVPPVFQAHGDADPTVPYQASLDLKKDYDKLGIKNELDTVPGGGHGGWKSEEKDRVALDSLKFLQSVGVIR